MEAQNHPLYPVDREHLNRLLSKNIPNNDDFILLARLLIRYEDFPGAKDLKMDMVKTLENWGLSREELNKTTKRLWSKGDATDATPQAASDEIVGSGFDASDNSVN